MRTWLEERGPLLASVLAITAALTLVACLAGDGGTDGSRTDRSLQTETCRHPDFEPDPRCGTLTVPEDSAVAAGRTIDLNFVVLPARDRKQRHDAVLYLVGGPGLAATESLPFFRQNLRELQQTRDIVLVDQRGTGASNPLDCDLTPQELLGAILAGRFEPSTIASCLDTLDADPTLYTSTQIVDDFEALRAALGYQRFDVVGVSYGSRLALDFLRRHPERARTIALRGVASPAGNLFTDIGSASEEALDRFFDRCDNDPDCGSRHSELEQTFRRVLSALEKDPPALEIDPPAGRSLRLELSRDLFAGAVRFALYSRTSAEIIPDLITDADEERWDALTAFLGNFLGPGLASSLSFGSYLSIVCAEDLPFFTPESEDLPPRLFFTPSVVENLYAACRAWPSRPVPREFKLPLRSSVPALLMSGSEDPATSASSAEAIARHLDDHRHLVTPGLAHMPTWTPCFARNLARFVESGSTSAVDESCADNEPTS